MSVSFKREYLGKGITFSEIIDKKFKSNSIVVRFIVPSDPVFSPQNAVISDLLSTSNSKYPSRESLNEVLAELYGSSVSSFSYRVSDYQVVGLSISYIGDEYTIGGEVISDKAVEIFGDCIFSPQLENGSFSEKYFNITKKELIANIRSLVNNKRQYAANNAYHEIFKNEPIAEPTLGTEENAVAMQLSQLYPSYEKLLSQAVIDVTYCGGSHSDSCEKLLERLLNISGRTDKKADFIKPSPLKDSVMRFDERIKVNQCKMFLAFKTTENNTYADRLMCAMLGGAPTSKLFMNVREKLSLCYYCASGLIGEKNTMIIDSGLDEDKLSEAESEILRQLESIRNGEFTDEELENVKLYVSNSFRSSYDSVAAMNSWYFQQMVRGTQYTPDDVSEIIYGVTRDDVIRSAKGYKLDTVFVLKPQVDTDGGDGENA